jgi:hypothetical protein
MVCLTRACYRAALFAILVPLAARGALVNPLRPDVSKTEPLFPRVSGESPEPVQGCPTPPNPVFNVYG